MTKRKKDNITASEMRYRRQFESAKDGIIILDATSGQVQDANPFLLDLLGYSLENLLGKELWEIGLFQDISESRAAFLELQDKGYIRYEDLPLETRDGRQIEVEFVSNVYLVNDKTVIQCNIRDITRRMQAEQAITASEMRYRRLFESAKDGIIILDATSGQVKDANPFLLDLLGYSLENLLGKELWEIGLFQDISESRAAFLELQDKGYIRYEDLPLETRDGRQIEVEFVSNVYLVNDETVIQCNIRDITGRVQAENEIRKLYTAVEQSGNSVVITDLQGTIEYVNPKFTESTGYTSDEAVGKNSRILKSGESSTEVYKELWETISGGHVWDGEFHNRKKNGELFWEWATISPVKDESGRIVNFLAVKEDVTKRKLDEEKLSQSETALNQAQKLAHLGSWVWHIQSNHLEWSDEMYRIFGIEKDTFSGDLNEIIERSIHPDDRERVNKANAAVINDKTPVPLEYRIIAPDETVKVVWAEAGEMILDSAGNPTVLTGIVQDITDRKQAEQAIRKSEALLTQMGRIAKIGAWELNTQTLELAWTEEVYRIHEVDMTYHPTLEKAISFYAPTSKPIIEKAVRRAMEHAEAFDLQLEFITAKGNHRWIQAQGMIHEQPDEARVLIGTFHDITERKQAEESIRFQAQLLNVVGQAVIATDREFKLIYWNRFAETLYGWSAEEAIGRNIVDLIAPIETSPQQAEEIISGLLSGNTRTSEFMVRRRDGTTFPTLTTNNPIINDQGTLVGLIGISMDITERKQMKMVLEQERTLLRTLIDHLPDRIYAKDIEGRFTIKNKADARQIGAASTTEVMGKTDFDYYPSALATQYQTDDQSVIQSGQSLINREEVFLNSDGNSGWMLTTKVPLKDDQGKVIGLVGIGRDITERKNAEEELRKLNRMLALISGVNKSIVRIRLLPELFERVCHIAIESGNFSMVWIGLLDSETSRVNPVAHGGVAEDYLEMLDIVLDDDDPRGHGPTATALRTGEPVIVNNIAQDPSMTPWRENALRLGYRASAAFPLNFAGEMRGVLNLYANQTDFFDAEELDQLSEMVADISFAMEFAENEAQRQQALMALQQHTQAVEAMRLFLQTTFDAFPANTVVLDPDGIIIDVNAPWIRFADENNAPSPMHYLGENYLTVCDTADGDWSEEAASSADGIRAVIDGSQDDFYLEYPCHSPSEKRWFVLQVTSFPEPAPCRVVVAHVNITERVLATELLAEQKVQLSERVKELNGLYTLSKLMEEDDPHLDTLFQAAVELIPATMQYPDIICACLAVEDRSYTTSNFRTTPWQIVSPVTVNSDQVGVLAIYYLEERPLQFDGPFLKEERLLLDEFARSLGNKIVTLRAEVALQEAHDKLEAKVLERTAELQMSKDRVEAILNSSADAILLLRHDLNIQQTNASFNSLFACEQDDYFDKSLNALLDANIANITDKVHQAATKQSKLAIDVVARRKDNTVFAAELGIGFIRDDSFVCSFHDISKRKRIELALQMAVEKEKELNELKTGFISMASHEFRTPLATIHATTETLSAYRHKLTEDKIELKLSNIRGQVGYLKDIIDDVLRLAQLQMRQVAFKPETVDFDVLCREVIDEFQTRTDVTHVLIYTCESAVPSAHLDKKLMRQLVSNLVSNAIKYSPQDKTIMLNLEYTSQTLVFSVQDSGIGIPEGDLKHLFEPFHRAGNVGTIHGTGLGLVIAKESIELHGGTITVESQIDTGTTFTVHIPIKTQGE